MNTATLNISKSLTVVTCNKVYMTKLNNLIAEATKFDIVNINGITKTEKLNKYLNIMIANGYKVIAENWNRANTIADGVSDFSIQLSK
jgi:hypothetical protein